MSSKVLVPGDENRLARLDRLIGELSAEKANSFRSPAGDSATRSAAATGPYTSPNPSSKDADVRSEIRSLSLSLTQLHQQVATCLERQASGPDAARQLQGVHDAQVDLSRRLDRLSSAFEERWSASASERLERAEAATESLSAVRGECRALVSEALARVADQFDALGASLEASLESRALEDRGERERALRERQGALREEVGGQLEALRAELRRQLAALSEAVGARLAQALAAPARELELAERKLAESVRDSSQALHARVDGAVADVGAAERAFQMGAAEHERRLAALEQGAALQAGDVRAQAEALLGDLVRANIRALAFEGGGGEQGQGAER